METFLPKFLNTWAGQCFLACAVLGVINWEIKTVTQERDRTAHIQRGIARGSLAAHRY